MPLIFYNSLLQCIIDRRFLSTRNAARNYYQVLNLPRNCTHRDIKESFIKLSKEHHPDINKHKDAHTKFLAINEAYKVLSKPEARRLYDLGFSRIPTYSENNNIHFQGDPFARDPWKDPSFYMNRDRSRDKYYEDKGYYGIKGIKRVSNLTVAIICMSVALIGIGFQILTIRYSYTLKRDQIIKHSKETEETLKQIKHTADRNGNTLQLELLKMRFENSGKYK